MATWDGSYQGPDGYYVYADQNNSSSNRNYFPQNSESTSTQSRSPCQYGTNPTTTFEQNGTIVYDRLENSRALPQVLNSQLTRNTNNAIQTTDGNNFNVSQSFYENSRHVPQMPSFYCRTGNYQKGNTRKGFSFDNVVENSNLQVTANEFVPSRRNIPNTSSSMLPETASHQNQDLENKVNVFYADNRSKYSDKRNENKKERIGKKKWEPRSNQFQRPERMQGKYDKSQNFSKFQNEKSYPHYRNYSDKTYNSGKNTRLGKEDAESTVVENGMNHVQNESINESQDSHNQHKEINTNTEQENVQFPKITKFYSNNSRQERYDRKDRYGDKYSPRDKKTNNQDTNFRSGYNKFDRTRDWNKDFLGETRERDKRDSSDWRQRGDSVNKCNLQKRTYNKKYEIDDDASQRERLTEQLNRGQLECLVCCDYIRQNDHVWSCLNCYHVLHLKCIKQWATSSKGESGDWRCPACQNVTSGVPENYFCFCGKTSAPEWNRREIAHSCGDVCGRARSVNNCVHKCTLLCHPGSCPPCVTMVSRSCGCSRVTQIQKCGTATLFTCDAICDRVLNCGIHKCESVCHHGSCEPCSKEITQNCHCGKHNRIQTCISDLPPTYSCGNTCGKTLDCNNHQCKDVCHPGSCRPCSLKVETVTHCCCGQTPLLIKRESCLDPIPTCDKVCSKRLKCGQPSNPHSCQANCHEGDCPECQLITKVRCRCGNMDREIPCIELTSKADDARCEKKCTKKRSCGKHKCNQMCCIDIEHICPLLCSKTLSCGKHKCEQTCHRGRCLPCWRSSFEELYCECGAAVIYPPVPCGTRRPVCEKLCSRVHSCGHEVLHNCHSDPTCPPCTVLTKKWCYGKHELRKSVPCYMNEISCGLSCNKPLSCGRHKCVTTCHPGPCEKPGQPCTQPCTTPRELCGHACAAPCHNDKCPDTPCKEIVKVTCQCGHRSTTRCCAENAKDYQRIASGILASKMADMQLGHTVNLEEVFGQGAKKQNQWKTLECNEECKLIERNRRLALGLQIVNPDLSGKLMPKYSTFMKQWAKKDAHFCQMVHDKLSELVQLAKTSKQKSRSYSFESMNRDKRHFIHESCEHFGCESQAYDEEPNRNVVATAVKDKCWLPSYSLLEMMQRENGQRKVPGPMLNKLMLRSSETVPLSSRKNIKLPPPPAISPSRSPEPEIDYFDYKG